MSITSMENMSDKIIVFTDGACSGNGTLNARAGIGVHYPNHEFENITEKFIHEPITNQRAELYSILTALKKITTHNIHKDIVIYSDSSYSIKCFTWIKNWSNNGWKTADRKPVKNLDIIKPINDIITSYDKNIKFVHVNSHTNNGTFESINNNIADELACNGKKL